MKMITELRQKSQITIPKVIVKKLSLNEGDRLEIYEENGAIHIVPVDVYPVGYIQGLKDEIERLKEKAGSEQ
jgi:AbrB family looped-hinge helix DNA binding protein